MPRPIRKRRHRLQYGDGEKSKCWKWNSQAAANRPSQNPGPGSNPSHWGWEARELQPTATVKIGGFFRPFKSHRMERSDFKRGKHTENAANRAGRSVPARRIVVAGQRRGAFEIARLCIESTARIRVRGRLGGAAGKAKSREEDKSKNGFHRLCADGPGTNYVASRRTILRPGLTARTYHSQNRRHSARMTVTPGTPLKNFTSVSGRASFPM